MVPKRFRARFDEIVALIDSFCNAHLNDEYKVVSREMAEVLCQEDSPVLSGKATGWAAGVVHAVGFVNFLSDPQNSPCMSGKQIADGFQVSEATMMAKSRTIRQGLDIIQCDPDWTVYSMLEKNPLIWMIQLKNGLIIDIRNAPIEFQKSAYEAGLIPFMPKEKELNRPTLPPAPALEIASKPKKSAPAAKTKPNKASLGPLLF